eukprot:5744386-Pyramimonas_sp.AAC.1
MPKSFENHRFRNDFTTGHPNKHATNMIPEKRPNHNLLEPIGLRGYRAIGLSSYEAIGRWGYTAIGL